MAGVSFEWSAPKLGKRSARPEGDRYGRVEDIICLLRSPTPTHDCKCAYINVRVQGMVPALVDSGAVKSAISLDLVQRLRLQIRHPRRNWKAIDGPARGVVGEVSFNVEYLHTFVHLSEVVVF